MFREEVTADHFNRFRLGRALDACYEYGCDSLFSELSLVVCRKEEIDCRFSSLDTTTFSVTGEYDNCSDEHAIEITYGYSKDHRQDLKQAVLELMVSQDAGVPIISKAWNGNSSDVNIFKKRARALVKQLKKGEPPRYLVADCKLYNEETVQNYLSEIPFITRIPSNITKERETIVQALKESKNMWHKLDDESLCIGIQTYHYGMHQRWIVVQSKEDPEKIERRVDKKIERERNKLKKDLKKHSKKVFYCKEDAVNSLESFSKKLKFHQVIVGHIEEEKRYESKGRPKKDKHYTLTYNVFLEEVLNVKAVNDEFVRISHYVIGTTISQSELSDEEVVKTYKKQNDTVEKGFRFLKDPLFFATSLFIKKPERIMGLLMIMTLALLVYSIAQRRMRKFLKANRKTLPNQIKKEINAPTLRWLFQMLDGIEYLKIRLKDTVKIVYTGLNDLKMRIIECFGGCAKKIYGIL